MHLGRHDSSRITSLGVDHAARADMLVALLCIPRVFFRLLLISDAGLTLSLPTTATSVVVVSSAQCACDLRADFEVSCRVFPTAGKRKGDLISQVVPCRLERRRASSNDASCEAATRARRCFGHVLAHLVSLHDSYSHQTPRKSMRSLLGCVRRSCAV